MKSTQLILFLTLIIVILAGCVSTDGKDDKSRYDINWGDSDQNTDSNQNPVDQNQPLEPNQFFCETNDDCVKTDALNCCGCESGSPEVAVSKRWLAAVTLPACSADVACTASYHCTDRVAQCVKNQCTLIQPNSTDGNMIYQTFQFNEAFPIQNDMIYQSDSKEIIITGVSVYEFYCPPGVPCAYRPDNVSFTIQLMDGEQVTSSQEIVLTQDGLTGQSILTKEWGSLTITLNQIRDRTATIIITKTA